MKWTRDLGRIYCCCSLWRFPSTCHANEQLNDTYDLRHRCIFFNFFADVANDVYLLWNLVLAKIWNDLIYVFNHPSIHPIFQKRNRSTETFRKEAYCFECGARFCWTQRPATQLNFVNDRLFLLYFVVHFTLSLQNSNTTRKSKV